MAKPAKQFRKQAAKAEAAALRTADEEISANLLALARAYRSQADVLDSKQEKKRESNG